MFNYNHTPYWREPIYTKPEENYDVIMYEGSSMGATGYFFENKKIAVVIPDRKDRPQFLENCLLQMRNQTLKPGIIHLVNFEPQNDKVDITKRYRIAYENLRNSGFELIAFIENDDAYANNYLEVMFNEWIKAGRPDLFGTTYTHYYHIKLKYYFTMFHYERSSMMNTFIKPDLNFKWCDDTVAYTDMHLWDNCKELTRALITPEKPIALGIKHGYGLCGGMSHNDKLDLYIGPRGKEDNNAELLKSVCNDSAFEFYNSFYDPSYKKRICG